MFYKFQKAHQTHQFAQTWQKALQKREIQKNNYRATGDIKRAKAFVAQVSNFSFQTRDQQPFEHVIFSNEAFAVPIRPAYVFTEYHS